MIDPATIRGLAYATPRTPSRPTYGPAVGRLAAAFGNPFTPWQQLVADVMLEVLPDGEWAYTDIVVTVQRQQGKTTLDGSLGVHRCLTRPYSSSWVTAQTRQDARDNFVDGFGPRFEASPLNGTVGRLRRSQGSERINFTQLGSLFGVFAPGDDALHGKQPAPQLVINDEHWAFDLVTGRAMGAAVGPTFTTSGGQWLRHSTAGTDESLWLKEDVAAGRAAVERGVTEGTAYFEIGFPEARRSELMELLQAEVDDPRFDAGVELLLEYMPNRGWRKPDGTLLLKDRVVRNEARKMRERDAVGEILRGYGNLWTSTVETVIPEGKWRAARRDVLARPQVPVALAFAASVDRSEAAIVAAWRDPGDPRARWRVIDHRAGTSWVAERFVQLVEEREPVVAGYDRYGPAADIGDEVERELGYQLTRITSPEMAAACLGVLAAVVDERLIYVGHDALDTVHERAASKKLGARWVWDLRGSGSIVALDAGTMAGWFFDHANTGPAAEVRFADD